MEKQRFEGHCQACCKQQRLNSMNELVHHGYERPGDGAIYGDCDGVGRYPIELSIAYSNQIIESIKTELSVHPIVLSNLYQDHETFYNSTRDYTYSVYQVNKDECSKIENLVSLYRKLNATIKRNHGKPVIDFMEAENRRKVELSQRPEKAKFGNWKYSKSRYEVTNDYTMSVQLEEYTNDSLRAFKRPSVDVVAELKQKLNESKSSRRMTDRIFTKMTTDLQQLLTYLELGE